MGTRLAPPSARSTCRHLGLYPLLGRAAVRPEKARRQALRVRRSVRAVTGHDRIKLLDILGKHTCVACCRGRLDLAHSAPSGCKNHE